MYQGQLVRRAVREPPDQQGRLGLWDSKDDKVQVDPVEWLVKLDL